MKACIACCIVKPLEEFYTLKRKGGIIYKNQCKRCTLIILSAQKKERKRNNPGRILWRTARQRALKKGIKFSIKVSDIIMPEYCPILGIKLAIGDGRIEDASPSLDRIVNKKGYVKGNVHIISNRANRIKNDSTLQELISIVRYLKRLKKL